MVDLSIATTARTYQFTKRPRLIKILHYQEWTPGNLSTPEWQARKLGASVVDRGLPEYVSLMGDWVHLSEVLQWYGFALLQESAGGSMTYDQLVHAYEWLYDGNTAFTNRFGTGTLKCYITKQHMTSEEIRQFPVVTGGNYLELAEPNPVYIGKWAWKIRVLNINEPPPPAAGWRNDFRIIKATNSWHEKLQDGSVRRGVEEFPQLNGRDVPVPIFSKDGFSYIETWKARPVLEDEPLTSVYFPATIYR